MEERNKKIFSTILLVVGVIFIIISGGIFVSQTWHYLPDFAKKLCLVAVTAGFFAGSYFAEKNSLSKTATAFYYLGTSFTGFSVISVMSRLETAESMNLLIAMLAMSVPVVLHFVKKRNLADLILQICLTDGMILCVSQMAAGNAGKAVMLCLSVFTMLLAGFVYYCKQSMPEEQGLMITGLAAYGIHAMITFPWVLWGLLVWESFFFSVCPIWMMIGSMTALYLAFQNVICRVGQSLLLLLGSLSITVFIFQKAFDGAYKNDISVMFFGAFLLGLILMVVLDRMELLIVNGILTFLYSLFQLGEYVFLAGEEEGLLFYPYGFCMVMALLAWKYFQRPDAAWKRVGKLAGVLGLLGANSLFAWVWYDYCTDYGVIFWLAIAFLMAASLTDSVKGLSALLKTMSLFLAIVALASNPIVKTVYYTADQALVADFSVEYACILMGLGIVLLGIIWYDVFREIRIFQFVGTCLLLMVLMLHNLALPALPNVLFLGVGTLIMLIAATVFKKKEYAIASAIVLILVVLHLTREVWMSIAWWVYLFAAGVGLVIFAIKKEKAEK